MIAIKHIERYQVAFTAGEIRTIPPKLSYLRLIYEQDISPNYGVFSNSSNNHKQFTATDSQLPVIVTAAIGRSKKLEAALNCISVSNDVMWGMPVFKGTRVLVETVIGSLEEGTSLALLKDSYAFLTEDLIEAAEIFTAIHPLQGHTPPVVRSHADWKLKSVEIIQPAENELPPIHRRMPSAKIGDDGT